MSATGVRLLGSILFTDLVGFTDYTDQLGDDAAVDLLDRQRRVVDRVLAADPGGHVVKELGDGLMLWYPDDVDGIVAARRLRDALTDAHGAGGLPLLVRMGVHHGEAVPRGDDLVGRAVNVAARVCELAGPGELLASAEAVDATAVGGTITRPIGPTRVKGVGDPIWLHVVG